MSINIVNSVFFTFVALLVSYNFHALWLIYDGLALLCLVYFLQNLKLSYSFLFLSFSVIYALISSFYSGLHLISFFSIWDNLKHWFIIWTVLYVISEQEWNRIQEYRNLLRSIVSVFFFASFFIALVQFYLGFNFDDISGVFGKGGTHALGLLILINFAFVLLDHKSHFYTIAIFVMSLIMIKIGEISAILPLMALLVFFIKPKIGLYLLLILSVLLTISPEIMGLVDKIWTRLIKYITYNKGDIFSIVPYHRASITAYAWYLGGLFGVGPGAFSDIYGLSGWQLGEYKEYQLCISAASQNIAEIGLVGLILFSLTYITLFLSFFNDLKYKVFVSVFFTLFILYNRVLMDERIIFLLLFLYTVFKIEEQKKQISLKENNQQ